VLTPTRPSTLRGGQTFSTTLTIGDDFAAAAREGQTIVTALHLDLPQLTDASGLAIKINGTAVERGAITTRWIDFAVAPTLLLRGANRIQITPASDATDMKLQDIVLSIDYRKG